MQLRALIFQDKNTQSWVAQCLEHDISAFGPSVSDAGHRLAEVLRHQAFLDAKMGHEPFEKFEEAPSEFWTHWSSLNSDPIQYESHQVSVHTRVAA